MNFKPKYKNFITRVWLQVYKTILFIIISTPIIAMINGTNILNIFLLGVTPVSLILLIRSFFLNRYYLMSIEVDEIITKLIIYKYDKEYKIYNIETKDLNVKIVQIFFSLRPFYKLQFFEKKKVIYQQFQGTQWQINLLVDLYKEIKKVKGEIAHTSWIKS